MRVVSCVGFKGLRCLVDEKVRKYGAAKRLSEDSYTSNDLGLSKSGGGGDKSKGMLKCK